MTAVRPTGDWDGRSFAHEGFVFGSEAELAARVMPFVTEGLERGEPVLVVAGEQVRRLLVDALGADIARLALFAAAETWWRGGHETLRAYDRDLRALRSRVPCWRLAAEPVWLGREDGREWSRFEAVANRGYAAMPYYSLCLHDARRLPAAALRSVARTHPLVWDGRAPAAGRDYEDPARFVRSEQPRWSPRPDAAAVARVIRPDEARRHLGAVLAGRWHEGGERSDDVLLAVHEIVINALRVSAFAELAVWTEQDRLVVEIADHGPGLPDETAGYLPPAREAAGGRGMWLAWSLADDASVASGAAGTRVRLYFAM